MLNTIASWFETIAACIFYCTMVWPIIYLLPALTLGFSPARLEIKEGSSAEAEVAILSPAVVDVEFTGRVTRIGSTGK